MGDFFVVKIKIYSLMLKIQIFGVGDADFMAGRSYIPIIVTTSEDESQSGGCNAGIEGTILLTSIVIALVKNHNSAK